MSRLDVPWALEQLSSFVNLTGSRVSSGPSRVVRYRGDESVIAGEAQVVEQILDQVLSKRWRQEAAVISKGSGHMRWNPLREMAARGLTQLRRQEELSSKLGDNAPQLDAGSLHWWVWEAARSLWDSAHYAEAVQAAAVRVNAETQRKVNRRDVGEVTLFQQVFSPDAPAAGKPRLQVVPQDGSPTASSRQRGARALGEGLYAGLRNPASHQEQELEEHEALEQLAAFSLLARWVDGSALRTAESK